MAIKFKPLTPAEEAAELVRAANPEVVQELKMLLASPLKPKRTRAPNGTFDRKAYQRELMRARRAKAKETK